MASLGSCVRCGSSGEQIRATMTQRVFGARMPIWMAAITALVAVVLTIVADRVALAAEVSRQETQIQNIQTQHVAMAATDDKLAAADKEILAAVSEVQRSLDSQAVVLQQVIDRQSEVRRALGILGPDPRVK